jgi:hypothetical protein
VKSLKIFNYDQIKFHLNSDSIFYPALGFYLEGRLYSNFIELPITIDQTNFPLSYVKAVTIGERGLQSDSAWSQTERLIRATNLGRVKRLKLRLLY